MAATFASPTLDRLIVRAGVAGQVVVNVTVTYGPGDTTDVTFVGSTYGAPGVVVMATDAWGQVRVDSPERFGETFGADWVRAFYA